MYASQATASSSSIQFQTSRSFKSHPKATTCRVSMGVATGKRPTAEQNLYEVLRLNRSASPAQIKASYRSLAKEFHPDANKTKSGPSDFIEIYNAYETLSDPLDRARYDLSLSLSLSNLGMRRHPVDSDFVGYHQTRTWETDQCW